MLKEGIAIQVGYGTVESSHKLVERGPRDHHNHQTDKLEGFGKVLGGVSFLQLRVTNFTDACCESEPEEPDSHGASSCDGVDSPPADAPVESIKEYLDHRNDED